MIFPKFEVIEETESSKVTKMTHKGEVKYYAEFYKEGWRDVSSSERKSFLVKSFCAESLEELKSKIN